MQFDYLTVASVLHDAAARAVAIAPYRARLEALGGRAIADSDLAEPAGSEPGSLPPPLFVFVLTGGTEADILRLKASAAGRGAPLYLIAHPYHNSLPAALEALARVRQDGGGGRIFFLAEPEAPAWAELVEAARRRTVADQLRTSRIGLIGASSDWLVASSQSPAAVAETWGATVVPIPIAALTERLTNTAVDDSPEFAFFRGANAVAEPKIADFAAAVGVYRALKSLTAEYRLDALTLRCFDLVLNNATTGCFALSRLNDDGIVAACEGDIPSVLALLWARRLTGASAWMANPARIDPASGRILLAHCTVPGSLVSNYSLRSHFESGLGVGIAGELRGDAATLLRIGGCRLERLWTAEGAIVARPREEGLCRTQVLVAIPGEAATNLLSDPLGNHLVLVPGHRAREFIDSFALVQHE